MTKGLILMLPVFALVMIIAWYLIVFSSVPVIGWILISLIFVTRVFIRIFFSKNPNKLTIKEWQTMTFKERFIWRFKNIRKQCF